jgi:hypothetical protein
MLSKVNSDYSFDVVGGVVINMKSGGVTKTISVNDMRIPVSFGLYDAPQDT